MTESTANITVPEHVAIVMDGNGRWAIKRNKKRMQGHKAGMDVAREVLEDCARAGVKILTLFAFSSENWKRPHEEVSYLMRLFVEGLTREANKLLENNIRMKVIGDHGRFPEKLQQAITKAELLTKDCDAMHLNIAANYGGRWDIADAARRMAEDAKAGRIAPEQIDEQTLASYISLAQLPELDLLIRTGGERRVSNFLLWQLAYAEFYFCEAYWPDFSEAELDAAIESFSSRQRRFGQTPEQAEATDQAARRA